MSDNLFTNKYKVEKILERGQYINYYLGKKHDDSEKEFLINEFTNRDLINKRLGDMVEIAEENRLTDYIESFSANSKFYAVFSYTSGRNIIKYIEIEMLTVEYKVLLTRKIMSKLLEYGGMSVLLRMSIMNPKNIIVEDNAIYFNYRIEAENIKSTLEEKDMFQAISVLIETIFTISEINADRKLFIIREKCEKGIYCAIGELIKDLDDLIGSMDKEASIKAMILQKKRKLQAVFIKSLIGVVLVVGAYSFYSEYIKRQESTSVYSNIESIGTVVIDKNNENSDSDRIDQTITVTPVEKTEEEEIVTEEIVTEEIAKEEEVVKEEPVAEEKVEEVLEKPTQTVQPTQPIEEVETPSSGQDKYYRVKKGENLYKICMNTYKNSKYLDVLASYNNISNITLIYEGQQINLPDVSVLDEMIANGGRLPSVNN